MANKAMQAYRRRKAENLQAGEMRDCLPGGGDAPAALAGATIRRFGSFKSGMNSLNEGGLVIEYSPAGSDTSRRAVFGFNDSGMWVDFDG